MKFSIHRSDLKPAEFDRLKKMTKEELFEHEGLNPENRWIYFIGCPYRGWDGKAPLEVNEHGEESLSPFEIAVYFVGPDGAYNERYQPIMILVEY